MYSAKNMICVLTTVVILAGFSISEPLNIPVESSEPQLSSPRRSSRQKRATATAAPFTKEEQDAGLQRHNEHRAAQNSSNMQYMHWNSELARMALNYVLKCSFQHSDMKNDGCYAIDYSTVGENLHFNTAKVTLSAAVDAWYEEIKWFNYDDVTCETGQMCGHYTQVVWAKSNIVGCGRAKCDVLELDDGETADKAYFTACNYARRGNYAKAKPYKKGEVCEECPDTCQMKLCYTNLTDSTRASVDKSKCPDTQTGGDRADNGAAYFHIHRGYVVFVVAAMLPWLRG